MWESLGSDAKNILYVIGLFSAVFAAVKLANGTDITSALAGLIVILIVTLRDHDNRIKKLEGKKPKTQERERGKRMKGAINLTYAVIILLIIILLWLLISGGG